MLSIRDLSVQRKLQRKTLVVLASFPVLGVWLTTTFDRVRVGGPLYNQVLNVKDLLADVLPPPGYIRSGAAAPAHSSVTCETEAPTPCPTES